MAQKNSSLPILHAAEVAKAAKQELANKGNFSGAVTRWPKWNRALSGGFRTKNVYMIAGMSGGGKSYMLNNLIDDFTNPNLNPNPATILHFGFEMLAVDEALRFSQRPAHVSYSYMVDPELHLSDSQTHRIHKGLDDYASRNIYTVETSGSLSDIWSTMKQFREDHPDEDVFVTMDHTLLARHKNEKDDIELLANIGKMSIDAKKYLDYGLILLNQMNAEIEEPRRISDRRLHFPLKRDIHGSKQIYWACDGVCIMHRPELLGITRYGNQEDDDGEIGYDTRGLVAAHWLKIRKGTPCLIRMREKLHFGTFEQWTNEQKTLLYE